MRSRRSSGGGRPALWIPVVLAGALALPVGALANHSTVERISAGVTGGNGTGPANFVGASADGTRAFFTTTESLVAGDTDSVSDLYERASGTTTRVSTGPSGGNGSFLASFNGASSDGTRVFFTTSEQLVAGDTDSLPDIYERFAGTTTQVSTGGAFTPTFNGASSDGTRVFFTTSEQLVAGDTDSQPDVYERSGGTTTRLSTSATNGNTELPASFDGASSDGTRVFFSTAEQMLPVELGDFQSDVFERSAGVTTRVSFGPSGGNGAFNATFAGSSADGTRVFFRTSESLVAGDTDTSLDVYERSGGTTTTRISVGAVNGNGAFAATFNRASADGTRVFFSSNESLVAGDTDSSQDVYERSGGTTAHVTTGPTGGNGTFDPTFAGASADGTRVFFRTFESLVAGDTDASHDIYERSAGTTTRLSTGAVGGNGAISVTFAGNSTDGTRVFFETSEQLATGDTDAATDIYERFGGATTRVSAGVTGGNDVWSATFSGASADGTRVFFTTQESLVSGDTDAIPDVYAAGIASTANYPRPGSATPTRLALVPAYEECAEANMTHAHAAPGPSAACNPPRLVSDFLTFGTVGQSSGFVRLDALVGVPGGADDSDLAIETFLSDVRNASGGTDYTGELQVSLELRVTDRQGGPGSTDPGTVADQSFAFAVPCVATGGSAGGTCSLTTTADTLVPGTIREGKRAIFDVRSLEVLDGGSDNDADTAGNTLLANWGAFVP